MQLFVEKIYFIVFFLIKMSFIGIYFSFLRFLLVFYGFIMVFYCCFFSCNVKKTREEQVFLTKQRKYLATCPFLKQKSNFLRVSRVYLAHFPAIFALIERNIIYAGKVFKLHGRFCETNLTILRKNFIRRIAIVLMALIFF